MRQGVQAAVSGSAEAGRFGAKTGRQRRQRRQTRQGASAVALMEGGRRRGLRREPDFKDRKTRLTQSGCVLGPWRFGRVRALKGLVSVRGIRGGDLRWSSLLHLYDLSPHTGIQQGRAGKPTCRTSARGGKKTSENRDAAVGARPVVFEA